MKKYIRKKKGFTLIEVLVVTVIIGILVAIAIPYYGRVVERMRIADVIVLMGTGRSAQDRNMLNKHHFTKYWHYLDSAPAQVTPPGTDNDYFNADRTEFYTRGGFLRGWYTPSYKVYFEEHEDGRWFIVADRIGWGGYRYSFVRDFNDTQTVCVPDLTDEDSAFYF